MAELMGNRNQYPRVGEFGKATWLLS